MDLTLISVIILFGILLLLIELLVIPGTTIAGFIGFGMIAFGIYLVFKNHGNSLGIIYLTTTAVISGISLYFSLRSNTWKKLSLNTELDGKVNEIPIDKIKIGLKGKSISRISPMGKALFENDYYEVSSQNEFISENSDIEIIEIKNNKIIVKQINQ